MSNASRVASEVTTFNVTTRLLVPPVRLEWVFSHHVATKRGVAARLDRRSRTRVSEDLLILERPEAVPVDENTALPSTVTAVAAKPGIGASLYRYAGEAEACGISILQIETALAARSPHSHSTVPNHVDISVYHRKYFQPAAGARPARRQGSSPL